MRREVRGPLGEWRGRGTGARAESGPGGWRSRAFLARLAVATGAAVLAGATAAAAGSGPASPGPGATYPKHSWSRDVPVLAVGAGTLLAGHLVSTDVRPVPPEGLDPASIRWSLDRDVLGNRDVGDDTASDWARNAAVAFPFVVGLATSPAEERIRDTGRRAILYAEAFLLGQGTVRLGKSLFSGARPFTYLAESERPDDPEYVATEERAFRTMPSGHSATAWTGASLGITEHLLSRPDAGGFERFAISFLGGALAASTSTLRVEAGQHFPTDVTVGAAMGVAIGVGLPLLHRGDRPMPSRRAWLTAAGGTLAGALVGAVVSAVD